MLKPPNAAGEPASASAIALGPRLLRVIGLCHRARRPVLLVGAPGLGKSESFAQAAAQLGIAVKVIDLSLCEPSDLVGLPQQKNGRTVFAPPSWLPDGGEGLLVFEELNRADRFILGPVLQLLTARRLNDYELPPGWSVAAAINPDDGQHDVRALDRAMLSRFVVVSVRADRREWLAWARRNGVHPAILHVVGTDSTSLEQVSPRSWTYASQLLYAMNDDDRKDRETMHAALSGLLPEAWSVAVLETFGRLRDGNLLAAELLRTCRTDQDVQARVAALRDAGRTDVLRAIADDLREILASPHELQRNVVQHALVLDDVDALATLLPGDLRETVHEALVANPIGMRLLGVDFHDVVIGGYQGRGYDWNLCEWQRIDALRYRARLFVQGLCSWLQTDANLLSIRRAMAPRRALGRILGDLRPELREQLQDRLARLTIEPVWERRGA